MTDSATSEDQCHQKKIFVGGLGQKTTTQMLCDYFGRYGTIADAVVLRWPDGRPRGFGYITFVSSTGVNAVLQESHSISGCAVDVKRAVPGTNKLFVGGLPQNTSAAEIRKHFEQFGIVSDAVVMMDPATNRSRGFGFICFSPGPDGAAAVSTALEQYDRHYLRGKWIEVKSAAPPRKLVADAPSEAPTASSMAKPKPTGESHVAQLATTEVAKATLPPPPPGLEPLTEGLSGEPQWLPYPPKAPQHSPCSFSTYFSGAASPSPLSEAGSLPSLLTGQHSRSHGGAARFEHLGFKGEKLSDTMAGVQSMQETSGERADQQDGNIFDASQDLRRSLEQLLRLQAGERISS